MKKLLLIGLLLSLFISACKKNDQICDECDGIGSKTIDMWVDAQYGPCDQADTIKPHCLMVEFETYTDSLWQPFDQDICGFEFTPGIWYHLEVKRKKIGEIDGQPQYKYCLTKIIETKQKFLK